MGNDMVLDTKVQLPNIVCDHCKKPIPLRDNVILDEGIVCEKCERVFCERCFHIHNHKVRVKF